ncbi:MAG: C40 family peptidase [Bacteroidetes bacterium]|nr:C40 family peptidase [Bacteroidota bacterium]
MVKAKIRLSFLIIFFVLIYLPGKSQTIVGDGALRIDSTYKKAPNDKASALINYAKNFLGVPYRYGGTTPSGFDCSGFINYVFRNFGFSLVRTSYGLAELGQTVAISEIQPGDLMFFKGSNVRSSSIGHVALVVEVANGDIRFIHSAGSSVRIDSFRKSRYYIQRYVKTKRLDYGGN